jgi:hypothetical protein
LEPARPGFIHRNRARLGQWKFVTCRTLPNLRKEIKMDSKMTFKPRQSTGWMWVGAIGLTSLAIIVGLVVSLGFSGPFLFAILLTGIIGTGFLFIAACFPTMRYEIGESNLLITYGPLLRYNVNLAEVKSIRRRDLGFSPVSSFRFPGLALFGVPYPEIGMVNMCATASSNGILIIETGSKKYGITPADETQFVAELRKRMGA